MAKAKGTLRDPRKRKGRLRKPHVAMLVYEFLDRQWRTLHDSNRNGYSSHSPKCPNEGQDSPSSRVSEAKHKINKRKKSGNSKMYLAKRGEVFKEPVMNTCVCKHGGEGIRKMKKYIQKALDFGIESGYLIPKDQAYRVLRVSSDLVSDGNYLKDIKSSSREVSQGRNGRLDRTPNKLRNCEVHDARCRRSHRKRRSRSGSGSRRRTSRRRKRGRKRSRSINRQQEVVEDDDCQFDKQPEKKNSTENASKEIRHNDQSNESDGEKTTIKKEEEGSDMSVDEDETDEDEKKGDDGNKS
ncbi:uncharacterized protein LOC143213618 [Lasioglossum baleicum]|uniref:uncharacterized protein LOC143213618 n=1 Tax=Lasioglossum baleicum TaxID=434251 RepID=UPI003FCE16CE